MRIAIDLEEQRSAFMDLKAEMQKELREMKSEMQTLVGSNGNVPIAQSICESVRSQLQQISTEVQSSICAKTTAMEARMMAAMDALDSRRERSTVDPSSISTVVPSTRSTVDAIDRGSIGEIDNIVDPALDAILDIQVEEVDYESFDREDVRDLQAQFCTHLWANPGDIARMHPVPEAYEFPKGEKMTVADLFEWWHVGIPSTIVPPFKCLRSWDVMEKRDVDFHKAKSVVETIIKHARDVGVLDRRVRIRDLSFEERTRTCRAGVEVIIKKHDEFLKEACDEALTDGRTTVRYVPFIPRKTTNLAYTTMHKYLHNAWRKKGGKRVT